MFNLIKFSRKPEEKGIVKISGSFDGKILGAENVIVTATGSCNSTIRAKNLSIDGIVRGNLDVDTLIINSGKLYYNMVKFSKLLLNEEGFIAHVSNTEKKRIPENCIANNSGSLAKKLKKSLLVREMLNGNSRLLKKFNVYINRKSEVNKVEDKIRPEKQVKEAGSNITVKPAAVIGQTAKIAKSTTVGVVPAITEKEKATELTAAGRPVETIARPAENKPDHKSKALNSKMSQQFNFSF